MISYYFLSAILFLCQLLLLAIRIISEAKYSKSVDAEGFKIKFRTALFCTPAMCIVISECTWNYNMYMLMWHALAFAYGIWLMLEVFLILITNNARLSMSLTLFVSFFYGLANNYVWTFKGAPLLPIDVISVKTATYVLDNYNLYIDDRILLGFMLASFFSILWVLFTDYAEIINIRSVKIVGAIILVWAAAIFSPIDMNFFEPIKTFQENGSVLSFLSYIKYMKHSSPKGYSSKKVRDIIPDTDDINSFVKEYAGDYPTVIVIMNESFADLSVLGDIDTSESLDFFNHMNRYIQKGYVYSSVHGGNTCNSEYEFLTGDSLANYAPGSCPYVQVDLDGAYSMVETFKHLGYDTIALHPYYRAGWNRAEVYNEFGFDRFITLEDMPDVENLTFTASDEYNYRWIKALFEEKINPLFIFNITMQNHGGYYGDYEKEVEDVDLEEDYLQFKDVVRYQTLIRESDSALRDLIDYFFAQDEPVIICFFGDHQPVLNQSFVDSIYKPYDLESTQKQYMTPYAIWSNYDTAGGEAGIIDTSINYLGSNLLKHMGIETYYTQYLNELQKELPIINSMGFRLPNGEWHSLEEENDLLSQYGIVEYYNEFGRK